MPILGYCAVYLLPRWAAMTPPPAEYTARMMIARAAWRAIIIEMMIACAGHERWRRRDISIYRTAMAMASWRRHNAIFPALCRRLARLSCGEPSPAYHYFLARRHARFLTMIYEISTMPTLSPPRRHTLTAPPPPRLNKNARPAITRLLPHRQEVGAGR